MNACEPVSLLQENSTRLGRWVVLLLLLLLVTIDPGSGSKRTSANSVAAGAICTWDLTTGDWSDGSKWSCGVPPGPGDTAIINGGTVTVSSDTSVGLLQLGAGTLTCNASLAVNESMTWTAGTVNGTGILISNGTLNISGSGQKNIAGATLENRGTATWLDGQFILTSNFDNAAGATFAMQAAGPMTGLGGSFNNAGAITKIAATTTLIDHVSLNNSGTVNINEGILTFSASNTTSDGALNIASGATLSLVGIATHTINASGSINGAGALDFAGGTANVNGSFNLTGIVSISSSALVNFNTPTNISTLNLSGGNISGNADVTILSGMNWTAGRISGSGEFTIHAGVTLDIAGANQKFLSGRTLSNNGTARWLGGQFVLESPIDNRAGATFDVQATGPMTGQGGSLNNAGTISKSTGSTATLVNVTLNNSGTVNVDAGILRFDGTSSSNTSGAYDIAAAATMSFMGFSSATHTISPGGSINGSGTLECVGPTLNVDGAFNLLGSVSIGSGTVRFNTATNITTLNFSTSGTLSGTGPLTVLNTMNWLGGDIDRTGSFTIQLGAILNISGDGFVGGAGFKNLRSPLINNGVTNYSGGHLMFASVFENRAGANFNIQTANPLEDDGGTIENAGTITKNGGNASLIRSPLNNSGRLEISSTSLFFQNAVGQTRTVNQTGGVTHLDDGTLGANLAINGGLLDGVGSVLGTVTNSGAISPGLATLAPGTITISNDYIQTSTGRLNIELGGANPGINSDLLITNTLTSTSTTLGGTLSVTLMSGFLPATDATFQIVRYLSHSGTFATTNGLDLGGGQVLAPDYRIGEVVLVSGDGGAGTPWVQVIADPQETRTFLAPATRLPRGVMRKLQLASNATGTRLTFQYNLVVGNSGGRAAPVVVVVEVPPAGPGVPVPHDLIEDSISNDPIVPIDDPADRELFTQTSKRVIKPDGTVLIPFVMVLPPHSHFVFPGGFESVVNTSAAGEITPQSRFNLQAGTGCPGSPEPRAKAFGNTLHAPSGECIKNILDLLLGLIPGGDCADLLKDIIKNVMLGAGTSAVTGTPVSLTSTLASIALEAAKCVADAFPVSKAIKIALELTEFASKVNDIYGLYDSCAGSVLPNPLAPEFSSEDDTKCVSSKDPNDKIGPDGATAERFITGAESLRYAVFFENVPDATAPAQVVSIADQLDPSLLNFNTFALGTISFAGKHMIPPPNASSFTADVDMRPEKNLLVRVNADLDKTTGLLTWAFTSIDPATGQPLPPTSVDGFLDPNITPPAGEGSVLFFVAPKTGLPTGAVIRNRATIVFDQNAPLDTPEWFNTLDNGKPTSNVLPLASSQCSSFRVEWSGSDATSGIAHYSIFVSKDGGIFEPWRLNTTQTSDFFNGAPGSVYAFYSIARDGAGNVEDPPTDPDTFATVTTLMSINPINDSFIAQGGDGSVEVIAPGGCNWIAVSSSFFIRIASGASGAGNGLVTYHLDPNPTDQPRQGAIVIAGQRFIVNQDAGPASSNRFPIAADDNASTNRDTPITVAVLANDIDPDGDALTVSSATPAGNGSVAINADGTLTYTPNPGFIGADSFTYTISDGRSGTATAAVSIIVTGFKCPQPQGYWKNNPGAWPVSSLTLGGQSYTKAELLNILNTPAGTGKNADASLILAYQLLAAKLNIANGSDPAPIGSIIADADSLLAAFTGKLPFKVKSSSSVGQNMVNTARALDSYNNGLLTPVCNP